MGGEIREERREKEESSEGSRERKRGEKCRGQRAEERGEVERGWENGV